MRLARLLPRAGLALAGWGGTVPHARPWAAAAGPEPVAFSPVPKHWNCERRYAAATDEAGYNEAVMSIAQDAAKGKDTTHLTVCVSPLFPGSCSASQFSPSLTHTLAISLHVSLSLSLSLSLVF